MVQHPRGMSRKRGSRGWQPIEAALVYEDLTVHVLTKIFIVLVSLLAVLLVPLVVAYAHNENSYQARYQNAEANAASQSAALRAAQAGFSATIGKKELQIEQLAVDNNDLRRQVDRREADATALESRLAEAEALDDEIRAQLATLVSSVDAGQQLTESLIEELRGLRVDALASDRRAVELDEALRDATAQLDVAIEARRALQEQLQRLKDEQASSLETIAGYVARFGTLEGDSVVLGLPPDQDLDATIIHVRRSQDQVLAEIDAGSRDGVKEGWVMTIGHGGGFIARLRIVNVDINRATGIVELEDQTARGRVEVGHLAFARTGR